MIRGAIYLLLLSGMIMVRAQTPGHLDLSFSSNILPAPDLAITQILPQPDGKILVVAGASIFRLASDGSPDSQFHLAAFTNPNLFTANLVNRITLQDDGKIVAVGYFASVDGQGFRGIARLNPDGTVDSTFNIGRGLETDGSTNGYRANDVLVQPDGRIVVGGRFARSNGTSRESLVRLNQDGSLDRAFISPIDRAGEVSSLIRESSGAIMVAGRFTVHLNNGAASFYDFVRLRSDGTINTNFNYVDVNFFPIARIAPHQGGFVVMTTPRYVAVKPCFRVNDDGSFDPIFTPIFNKSDAVFDLSVQPDGKVLMAGQFNGVSGVPRLNLARLLSDGTVEGGFDTLNGPDSLVTALALSGTNRILIGGAFKRIEGIDRPTIARLYGGDPTLSAPRIIRQPVSQTLPEGDNAILGADVAGFPLSIHWEHNGVTLAGATNASLFVFSTRTADTGVYTLANQPFFKGREEGVTCLGFNVRHIGIVRFRRKLRPVDQWCE